MTLPLKIIFICSKKEMEGINFQNCALLNSGKQSPFTRAWDEYSEGDFNMIVTLTIGHFVISPAQATSSNVSFPVPAFHQFPKDETESSAEASRSVQSSGSQGVLPVTIMCILCLEFWFSACPRWRGDSLWLEVVIVVATQPPTLT